MKAKNEVGYISSPEDFISNMHEFLYNVGMNNMFQETNNGDHPRWMQLQEQLYEGLLVSYTHFYRILQTNLNKKKEDNKIQFEKD